MPSRTFDITIAFHFFQNFHQSVPRTALVLVKDINFLSDVLSESLVRKSVMSLCPPQWCRVASKLCFICSLLWIHGSLLVGGQARLGGPHFRPLLAGKERESFPFLLLLLLLLHREMGNCAISGSVPFCSGNLNKRWIISALHPS